MRLLRNFTCELLHGLQPHADGLVGEQRRGGQRARHALHDANVLHALGHRERGHGVVGFKGTVAVYAATCRMGGERDQRETLPSNKRSSRFPKDQGRVFFTLEINFKN